MSALALQSGYVRVTEHGKLLEVTLDRADKLNALSGEMYRDISRAVDHYRDRDDLTALLLDAEGRAFTAGNDIGDFLNADPESRKDGKQSPAMDLVHRLIELDKPVIAAVNGIACGGGLELALSADMILCADHAQFALPEIRSGTVADAASVKLPKRIPYHIAMELLFTGRWFDAAEAVDNGFADSAADDGDEIAPSAFAYSVYRNSPESCLAHAVPLKEPPAAASADADRARDATFGLYVRGVFGARTKRYFRTRLVLRWARFGARKSRRLCHAGTGQSANHGFA